MINNRLCARMRFVLQVTEKVRAAQGQGWEDSVLEERDVHPMFDSATRNWDRDGDEAYLEDKIDMDLTFAGDDYAYILYGADGEPRPLHYKYVLKIYYDGHYVKDVYFRKSGCEIDEDHRSVKVSLKEYSVYDKFKNGKGDEYNLAKMDIEKRDSQYAVHPVLQVYSLGKSEVMSSHANGSLVSRQCAEEYDIDTLLRVPDDTAAGYSMFVLCMSSLLVHDPNHTEFYFNGNGGEVYTSIPSGRYNLGTFNNTDGANFAISTDGTTVTFVAQRLGVRFSGSMALRRALTEGEAVLGQTLPVGEHDTLKIEFAIRIYGWRVMYNQGMTQFDDGFMSSSIYNKVLYSYLGSQPIAAVQSTMSQPYMEIPDSEALGWHFYVNTNYMQGFGIYDEYTRINPIRDLMSLGDVIKAMMEKVDSDVVFEKDEDHSEFLFASVNPVTDEDNTHYYITQKSNVLSSHSTKGAWKVPLTMEQLLELLRNAMNLYYDIYETADGKRHLRIEHRLFYMNGYSYGASSANVIDLTKSIDVYSKKKLSRETHHWSYDTSDCPTRIEFEWMDEQSEAFGGTPIEVAENRMLINTNYTDKRQVSYFSSDIDYLMLNQAEASYDGFFIVSATEEDGVLVIDSGEVEYAGGQQMLLNYRLSMPYLQSHYWRYGIAARYAVINGVETEIENMPKMRRSEVSFVLPVGSRIGVSSIIKTDNGVGEVVSMSYEFGSGKVTATLKYETE